MLNKIKNLIQNWRPLNIRDRRGHYASQNQTCLREQYWHWIGEPETNPIDFVGKMKMMIGDWIEAGLVKDVLGRLHFLNIHLIGTQIPVGGSNPNWDGYVDALVEDRSKEPFTKIAIEVKTKSGLGADQFLKNPVPSIDYVAQLGLYLKDLSSKVGITDGKFIYLLLSDNTWGTIVIVDCKYDPNEDLFHVIKAYVSDGTNYAINKSYKVQEFLNRWIELDKYIANGIIPKGEYTYMYPITEETVRSIPDDKLKKIINRQIVYGDWQLLYSRYKDKHIEVDGLSYERSDEEISLCKREYKRRHPKSKI